MPATEMRKVKLKDVCDRITVGHVGPMADKYTPDGVPFLRSQNIAPFRLNVDDIKYVPREFHEKLRKSALQPGDVAVVRTGYPGTACVIPNTFKELNCADLVVISPSSELNPHYLAAIFNSAWGMASVAGNLVGVAQQHFNVGAAKELVVGLPPRPTQDRIAGILSAYDELIENSQRRIKILESMARALYREWFVHFRFPGHENHPRVASPLGEIPQGWEVKSLADLMEISGGSQPPKSEFIYQPQDGFVRLIQIRDYESDSHLTFVRESSKLRRCKRTDILIARYGASVARICSGLEGAYNVALAKVIPVVPHCQEFLRQFLSDDEFQKLLIGMSGRAAQNGFNKSDIAAVRVAVPTDAQLFERFERIAVSIWDSVLCLRDKIENLRRTRDLLLPRLLSGQIDVAALSGEEADSPSTNVY